MTKSHFFTILRTLFTTQNDDVILVELSALNYQLADDKHNSSEVKNRHCSEVRLEMFRIFGSAQSLCLALKSAR